MSARPSEVQTEAPRYVLPILLILVSIAFFALILGFYKAIVWAFVFALLSRPFYEALQRRLGGRDMAAAGLTTLVVVLVVLVPAVAFGMVLANQAADVAESIKDGEIDPAAPVEYVTGLAPRLEEGLKGIGLDLAKCFAADGHPRATVDRLDEMAAAVAIDGLETHAPGIDPARVRDHVKRHLRGVVERQRDAALRAEDRSRHRAVEDQRHPRATGIHIDGRSWTLDRDLGAQPADAHVADRVHDGEVLIGGLCHDRPRGLLDVGRAVACAE